MAKNIPLNYEKREKIESAIKDRYSSDEAEVCSVILTIDKENGCCINGTADIFFKGNSTRFGAIFEYRYLYDSGKWKLIIPHDWND